MADLTINTDITNGYITITDMIDSYNKLAINPIVSYITTEEKENKEKTFNILNELDKYIINKNATILFWKDGTKTIVKLSDGDIFDARLGFLIGYFQKTSGLSKNKANKYLYNLKENID